MRKLWTIDIYQTSPGCRVRIRDEHRALQYDGRGTSLPQAFRAAEVQFVHKPPVVPFENTTTTEQKVRAMLEVVREVPDDAEAFAMVNAYHKLREVLLDASPAT